MTKASSSIAVAACLLLAAGGSVRQANSQAASPPLDYEFFKNKVQAVFLHKRQDHTRCVACHTVNNVLTMHLVPLSPGATTWNEEQSRQNFQLVQKVVVPGFEGSKLLTHPLAIAAGGDPNHGGGKHFASQQDPEWSILKAFVFGAK
jgi:hypothetical protein